MATTDLTRALVSLAIGWATLHTAAGQYGTTIYDTGGSGRNYGNSQNLTWTYCAPPGQYLTITFTYFDTELDYDWLSIHDGATNAAPMLGEWSGTGNIGCAICPARVARIPAVPARWPAMIRNAKSGR